MKKAVLPDGRNSRAEEQKTCLGHSVLAFLMQVYQVNHLLHSSGAVRKDYFIFLICTRKKKKDFGENSVRHERVYEIIYKELHHMS